MTRVRRRGMLLAMLSYADKKEVEEAAVEVKVETEVEMGVEVKVKVKVEVEVEVEEDGRNLISSPTLAVATVEKKIGGKCGGDGAVSVT